jgi:hypothetical protein
MPATDEFVPELPVVEEVVKVALLPVIQCCEETLGESLFAKLVVVSGDVEGPSLLIRGTREQAGATIRGTIRLIFRRTYSPHRHRFHIEAIYPDLAASKMGFSGFVISGDVKLEQGQIQVKTRGGIYRNNVWEWQGWQ